MDLGTPREAEIFAEDLSACSIPVVAVLGNHDYVSDCVDDGRRIVRRADAHISSMAPKTSYAGSSD